MVPAASKDPVSGLRKGVLPPPLPLEVARELEGLWVAGEAGGTRFGPGQVQ